MSGGARPGSQPPPAGGPARRPAAGGSSARGPACARAGLLWCPLCVPSAHLKWEGRQSQAGLEEEGGLAHPPLCFRPRRLRSAVPAPPSRRVLWHREPASFPGAISQSADSGTACTRPRRGQAGGGGRLRAAPPAVVGAAHSRKSGVIAPRAGVQAVSGSVFFNSKGALGSRGGYGGQPAGVDRPREVQDAPRGR